ncbi:MAG: adenylate kinase [Bacteroidetes bacterium]|nr:MAG: adenylate kinase [Bacteroidota bacterium]
MLNIVLFGPPGAGKGTQSQLIIEKFGLLHISTGDLLRAEVAAQSPLGLSAKEFMNKGLLVPDEVIIGMIDNKMRSTKDIKGCICDGFPRTVDQAVSLDKIFANNGSKINGMIALEVDDEELTKRILLRGETSGRADDQNESLIRQRVQEYNEKTAPVAGFYKSQGKFASINGLGTVEEIFANICTEIEKLQK